MKCVCRVTNFQLKWFTVICKVIFQIEESVYEKLYPAKYNNFQESWNWKQSTDLLRNSFQRVWCYINEACKTHGLHSSNLWGTSFLLFQLGAFPVTRWAIHPRPSYNPSPVRAEQAWICQSWFLMLWRESASVISAGAMASLRSCLLAKTSTTECWRSSCPSNLNNSSFIIEILALSVLSITAMIAWVPR